MVLPGHNRGDWIFAALVLVSCVVLWNLPTGFEDRSAISDNPRVRGTVVSVDNSDIKRIGAVRTGAQDLIVRIESGGFKGREVKTTNVLMGQLSLDKMYVPDDRVLVILRLNQDGSQINSAGVRDRYHIGAEIVLFSLFALILLLFAGYTGLKALVSFVFTGLAIWKVLIPLFLKGYSPIAVSACICISLSSVILLLIAGFSRKSLVAILGAGFGIVVTGVIAVVFGRYFQVPGTVKDFAEMLLYSGFLSLDLTKIFIAGVYVAATGAVMDIAMDIASAQEEIVRANPGIERRELVAAGFRIGRAVIGTMTTTLLFAYSGHFTFMLMFFLSQGLPTDVILNINFVAAEILHTVVGSIGLVLVAPITALCGGFLYPRSSHL